MNSALRRRQTVLHALAAAEAAGYFDSALTAKTAQRKAEELLGAEYEDLRVECTGMRAQIVAREPGETDTELRFRLEAGLRWRWLVNGSSEEDFK